MYINGLLIKLLFKIVALNLMSVPFYQQSLFDDSKPHVILMISFYRY